MFGFELMVQFGRATSDLCCNANEVVGLNLCDAPPVSGIVCPDIQALSMIAAVRSHRRAPLCTFLQRKPQALAQNEISWARAIALDGSSITEHPSVIELIQIKGGVPCPR
jgi:hypothetical protein